MRWLSNWCTPTHPLFPAWCWLPQLLTAVLDFAGKSLKTLGAQRPPTQYTLAAHGNLIGEYPQAVRAEFSLAPVTPLAMTMPMVTSGSFTHIRVPATGRLENLIAGAGVCVGGGAVVLRWLTIPAASRGGGCLDACAPL